MYKYPFLNPDLSLDIRINDLISRLSLDEKIGFLSTHNKPVERLGIKEWLIGTEIARGLVLRAGEDEQETTVTPQPIGMASMFDPELMYKLGELAGIESRIYWQKEKNSRLMVWGPTVDMERNPLWGRNEEAYGEDPFLTGEMTIQYTKGLRGEHPFYMRTIPTLKHFCANNNEEGRGNCSANLSPRLKHEYYYAAFKPAITEGGAYSMMAAYNELNGVPAVINPDLQKIVKDEWGLGFIVTDGGDFGQNVNLHKYSLSHAETLALCLKNGTDVMTDNTELVTASAYDALRFGYITEKDIDKTIYNTLDGRFRLGEFDGERNPYLYTDPNLLCCDEFRSLIRKASEKGITLLKNNGLLPFSKDKTVAIVGNTADTNYMDWYTGVSKNEISIYTALKNHLGDTLVHYDDSCHRVRIRCFNGKYLSLHEDNFIYADGDGSTPDCIFIKQEWDGEITYTANNGMYLEVKGAVSATSNTTYRWHCNEIFRPYLYLDKTAFLSRDNKRIKVDKNGQLLSCSESGITPYMLFDEEIVEDALVKAATLAKESDIAIVCVGNNPMFVARECYDRTHLELSKHDDELIKTVYSANRNTIVIVVSSYPYAINWAQEHIPAIVYTSHAGPELGNALTDALLGNINPAGRTPQTWYRSHYDLPSIMDYDIINNESTYQYFKGTPLYPFGYGLSYSSFDYSDMNLNQSGDDITVSFKVKNSSSVNGEEVCQLYFNENNPHVKRPLKQLCGFKRIMIPSGEEVDIMITTSLSQLAFYDVSQEKMVTPSGLYTFYVGSHCEDKRLIKELDIIADTIPNRIVRNFTDAFLYEESEGAEIKFTKEHYRHYVSQVGWNTTLTYKQCDVAGAKYAEFKASTLARPGKIELYLDDPNNNPVCSIEVAPSSSPTSFSVLRSSFDELDGIHNIIIKLNMEVNLLEFRIY